MTCLGRVARVASAVRWPEREAFPLVERLPSRLALDRHRSPARVDRARGLLGASLDAFLVARYRRSGSRMLAPFVAHLAGPASTDSR